MRLYELEFRPTPEIEAMSDQERHELLSFVYHWLSGKYMREDGQDALQKWRYLATLFPPKIPDRVNLFRLVTVPISYAQRQRIRFRPAPGPVSSWSRTLVGIDAVAGVASDLAGNMHSTARIGIETTIPGRLVLATTKSIRDAFMTLSHDYFDRYKETRKDGDIVHPGYPGGEKEIDSDFTMYDVGFLHDVLNRPGGHYRQYEWIVETPARVDATVVQIYRVGNDHRRIGNDDPHQFLGGKRPPRITRMKPR